MTKVLKGLCFGGLGAILACILTFVVVMSYSYTAPTGDLVIVAVSIGALVGCVVGAIWWSVAIKCLLEGLMHF